MKLGHDLYQWRKANKVSQAKVADMLGVDVMTVSRWEAGIHHPQGKKAQAIKMLISAPLRSSLPPEADPREQFLREAFRALPDEMQTELLAFASKLVGRARNGTD